MFELEVDEELEIEKVDRIECELKRMKEPFVLTLGILKAEPYPSNATLARLADVVKLQKTDDYGNELPKDWVLLATGSSPKRKDKNKMYFGAAFIHHEARQVVVAHHATSKNSTDKISAHAVHINSATTFMNRVREVILESAGGCNYYNLTITGHRLGGWLAQITAFTVKYLSIHEGLFKNDVSSKLHPKTVVFDSPGARDLLNTLLDVYYDRYRMKVLDALNITVYVSTQNEMNTCGLHLGKVYSVSNNNDGKIEEGMKYFIDVFDKDALEICVIFDWAKNKNEFSFSKNNSNKDSKYVQTNSLTKKSLRQAELKCQPNDENISSHLNNFAEDELLMLYKLHIIQEQKSNVKILIEKMEICFPYFEIDPYNRTIRCNSRKSLDELTSSLKQLMRYMETQFSAAVEKQIAEFPFAADLIYRAEGQSYLGSSPRSTVDFSDSIGLQKFLSSETLKVLQVDSLDGEFEMNRLQNIFFQIKNSQNLPSQIQKYTGDHHYTFLNWQRLQKLYMFDSPVHQNDLMMVDGGSKDEFKTISEEDVKPLIDYLKRPLKKLVFISKPTDNNIFNSIEKNLLIKTEGNINFKNLSEESQNTVLKKKMIFTGNKGFSFREFMGENSSLDDVNELLSLNNLKNITSNEDYVINLKGTRPNLDSRPQMPLYKTNIKTSKEFILNCVKSPNILVVVSGLSHEELETENRAGWEQLKLIGKNTLHQSPEDAKLFFNKMCNKNPDKSVYLLAVTGEDIFCKLIFNPGFYLPRTFFHRAFIDPQKFVKTNFTDDLFVISSEEENALLAGLMENCSQTKKFMEIVAKENEVEIIKNNFTKNIHFVKIDKIGNENKFILEWRYSHGSAEKLRPCVSMDSSEPIDEAALALTERNIVILADDPGTGKTTTLERLSRILVSEWVIYIRFKYFKTHIESLPEKLDAKNVACFLLSECSHADLDCRLLEYLLERNSCSRRIVVMFAGFDELDDYKDTEKDIAKNKITNLLNFLKNKPTVQIFLTVRKYLKEFLESTLGQISTFFKGISEQQQVDLLVKFWLSRATLELRDNGEEEKRRFEDLARDLLSEVKRVLGPDNYHFIEVPLHMQMLVEYFSPQIEWQIDPISAPNLFKRFINLSFEIYVQDKLPLPIGDIYNDILKHKLTKNLRKLGFKKYFSTFYDSFYKPIAIECLMNLNRYGLLQSKENGEFTFVYQANAEYCCAQMVVRCLKQRESPSAPPLIKEILVTKLLLLPDYKAIRWFMNAELKETQNCDALELNAAVISELCQENNASVILKNQENKTALQIAIDENNEHIVKLVRSRSSSEST